MLAVLDRYRKMSCSLESFSWWSLDSDEIRGGDRGLDISGFKAVVLVGSGWLDSSSVAQHVSWCSVSIYKDATQTGEGIRDSNVSLLIFCSSTSQCSVDIFPESSAG